MRAVKLSLVCRHLECAFPPGCEDREISAIASPEQADESSILFVARGCYREAVRKSRAQVVVVKKGEDIPGKILLQVDDPYLAFARLGGIFEEPRPLFPPQERSSSHIDPSARIDDSASIGPCCVIGGDAVIGKETVMGAGCIIENGVHVGCQCRIDSGAIIRRGCVVGDRVIVQSGAIIGSEGFGNAWNGNAFVRIPSFGNVILEDDVEVGAGTTIDRGTLGSTIIRRGVKLDNLVHIAHNVEVGEHSAMAAQCGVSGSTRIGRRVKIGGQAGFVGHIAVGDDAFVGAKAGVSKDVAAGSQVTGYPARDLMSMRRIEAAQHRLPDLLREIRAFRKKLEQLENRGKQGFVLAAPIVYFVMFELALKT